MNSSVVLIIVDRRWALHRLHHDDATAEADSSSSSVSADDVA